MNSVLFVKKIPPECDDIDSCLSDESAVLRDSVTRWPGFTSISKLVQQYVQYWCGYRVQSHLIMRLCAWCAKCLVHIIVALYGFAFNGSRELCVSVWIWLKGKVSLSKRCRGKTIGDTYGFVSWVWWACMANFPPTEKECFSMWPIIRWRPIGTSIRSWTFYCTQRTRIRINTR